MPSKISYLSIILLFIYIYRYWKNSQKNCVVMFQCIYTVRSCSCPSSSLHRKYEFTTYTCHEFIQTKDKLYIKAYRIHTLAYKTQSTHIIMTCNILVIFILGLLKAIIVAYKSKLLCTGRISDTQRWCTQLHLLYFQWIHGGHAEQYGRGYFR